MGGASGKKHEMHWGTDSLSVFRAFLPAFRRQCTFLPAEADHRAVLALGGASAIKDNTIHWGTIFASGPSSSLRRLTVRFQRDSYVQIINYDVLIWTCMFTLQVERNFRIVLHEHWCCILIFFMRYCMIRLLNILPFFESSFLCIHKKTASSVRPSLVLRDYVKKSNLITIIY